MPEPTAEQQSVLNFPEARIRVVRAAPGSGKTWLVAELIRREIARWDAPTGGIAALSFTRVGGREITRAVGHELDHPHFVGTIDAFLFRYVVRPFLNQCSSTFASPRLIPEEWGAKLWGKCSAGSLTTKTNHLKILGCIFRGEDNNQKATVWHKWPHQS